MNLFSFSSFNYPKCKAIFKEISLKVYIYNVCTFG